MRKRRQAGRPLWRIGEAEAMIEACREGCRERGEPFHADALAAALGVSYETLAALVSGSEACPEALRAVLTAAMQECTASVIAAALAADPRSHGLWTFYLRNRAGFAEKGERPVGHSEPGVVFVGEERI